MKLIFADEAWEDYLFWQKQDKKMVERINKLIAEVKREPFSGVGKPEPLKHALSGYWSRRINDEHRMVYRIEGESLLLAQLRYHYGDTHRVKGMPPCRASRAAATDRVKLAAGPGGSSKTRMPQL